MKYKKLWTDMHSNIHHEQMEELPLWYSQIKKTMDFGLWPIIPSICVLQSGG